MFCHGAHCIESDLTLDYHDLVYHRMNLLQMGQGRMTLFFIRIQVSENCMNELHMQ